jgi:hypothetical protein
MYWSIPPKNREPGFIFKTVFCTWLIKIHLKMKRIIFYISAIFLINILGCQAQPNPVKSRAEGISVYPENPYYWQYKGKPVLLLGGSSNDNLFQQSFAGLDEELDKLVSYGGNYLRCSMSSRDEGDEFPFYRDEQTGLYDLGKWNDNYWEKLDYFLEATRKREIIVQIEIWETYDFYTRSSHVIDGKTAWERNPFNPVNNGNYSESESGMFNIFRSNGQEIINPFFNTVLPLPEPFNFETRPVVLAYQQKFVDKLLSLSLKYNHVLYCIDNETQADPKWSVYWSQYIRKRAKEQNTSIEVTEMFDPFDPTGGAVEGAVMQSLSTHFFTLRSNVSVTLNDPVNFSFIEISNNNAQTGQVHFETAYYIREKIQDSGILRPINNVKIYGAGEGGWNGSAKDGQERFWRNVFAGAASVRFHRPDAGLGSSDVALSHIKSMRMLTSEMDFFNHKPANHLLSNREANEAYCLASEEKEYAVYFPGKGDVTLNVPSGKYEIRWMNILTSEWSRIETMELPGELKTPTDDQWAVYLKKHIL